MAHSKFAVLLSHPLSKKTHTMTHETNEGQIGDKTKYTLIVKKNNQRSKSKEIIHK